MTAGRLNIKRKVECAWAVRDRMTARRLNIKRKAAALEAAEAQRRFQAETLGEAAQPAEGPNQDRFLQQLTGRVRSALNRTTSEEQPPAELQLPLHHLRQVTCAASALAGQLLSERMHRASPCRDQGRACLAPGPETDGAQWACRATPKRRGRAAAPPSSKAKARGRARGQMARLRHRARALGTSLGRRAAAAARTFRQTHGRQSGSIKAARAGSLQQYLRRIFIGTMLHFLQPFWAE